MTPGITNSNSSSGASGAAAPAPAGNDMVSKNMFLQLLVAQIKNQDPLNPADGVQFLTQLAQFTQLEQTLGMSTDLAAIRQDLEQLLSQDAPPQGTQP